VTEKSFFNHNARQLEIKVSIALVLNSFIKNLLMTWKTCLSNLLVPVITEYW